MKGETPSKEKQGFYAFERRDDVGMLINAPEALELGIVDQVHGTKDLEEEAVNFLKGLVERRSIEAIRSVMTAINNGRTLSREKALAEETRLFCRLARNRDE